MKWEKLNGTGKYSVQLPCTIGTKVYVITSCRDIQSQSDGTYDTATGYYCPYEDECPYMVDDCDGSNEKIAVFEDVVDSIIIDEISIRVTTKNMSVSKEIGKNAFFTREDAEAELKNLESEI